MAEVNIQGNVNVSKFGTRAVGCRGFIDITQPVKKVIFLGTFTAGGLEVGIIDGKLKIVKEGKTKNLFNKYVKLHLVESMQEKEINLFILSRNVQFLGLYQMELN